MKYYKIIQDNNFIGVACSTDFVRYQKRNHCLVSATEMNGEFVECNGQLYRSTWMPPVPNEFIRSFEQAIIIEINEEEYNIYHQAIERNEKITVDEDEYDIPLPTIIEDPINSTSIDLIRSLTLDNIKYECRKTIEAGFDWKDKHYSLTTQDQLNLTDLNMLADVQDEIPYHADGEEVKLYSAAEIKELAAKATKFKIYQTTYYNSLKNYVNSLQTIEEIADITYGMEIPEEYKTEALKSLEG